MATASVHTPETTRLQRLLPWVGWLFSAGAIAILVISARWKLTSTAFYVNEWVRIGWDPAKLPLVASLQVTSLILYLIPQTSVLGVVLLTGYLGGAISQYTRMGEPYPILVPLSTALCAWVGLWLREPRLRALLPIRLKRTAE